MAKIIAARSRNEKTGFPPGQGGVFSRQPLSREIAAALLIKAVLLAGLWYLAFRHDGGGKPAAKPDIAERFLPAQAQAPLHTPLNPLENRHVR